MKISAKISDVIYVDVEGDSQVDVFEQLSSAQEIFGNDTCGKCKGQNIRYVVRKVKDDTFYELQCQDCRSKLTFGLHKKSGGKTMFPHRKDDKGYLPNQGWVKYEKPVE